MVDIQSATAENRRGKKDRTRMWANAQRDGCPAEHRWRRLFNAAKNGWRPLLDCRAVTLPRHDTRWNMMGCPKPANQSQPLVFFWIVDTCLSSKNIARQSCVMVLRWRFFASFLHPVFLASRLQHISDLHSKFAPRPHHVSNYGRHPICGCWD